MDPTMTPNTLPWIVYALACVFEIVIMSVHLSRKRRVLAGGILLVTLAMTQGALLFGEPLIFGIPFFIIGLYRLLNIMRFVYGRMHEEYLFRVVPRSSFIIAITQTITGIAALIAARHHPSVTTVLTMLSLIQLSAALLLVFSLRVNVKKSNFTVPEAIPDNRLPTVSVLIPARNETSDLEACLLTLTASTYQKLEILVLDDCSQDRTPEIIKKFAHDGVRFIRGSEPGEVWLPKNAAYDKLAHEASGEYLLFCGVDVRFAPDDIRTLVSYLQEQKLTMVSVMPMRDSSATSNSIVQQLRYLWELSLPRTLANRPPVLSTLWLIQATALKKYGGMGAVRRNVVPEGFFARELTKKSMYRFLRAGNFLGITSVKPSKEQRDTALRVRYPQLHRRPEVVLAVTLFEIIALLATYATAIYAAIAGHSIVFAICATAILLHIILFVSLARAMGSKGVSFYVQSMAAVLVDLWLMHRSMYLYEFDEVRWKERNVCLPVMHAFPSMPSLPPGKLIRK